MAQATGAHSAYDEPIGTGGNREDLSDLLFNVAPTETPFATGAGKNRATAIFHDWLTDTLEDAAENADIEGNDAVPVAPASRVRLRNNTNILKKWAVVTGTQERVLKGGGVKSEMSYQTANRMKAIKRDFEYMCVGVSNVKVDGSDSAAREMGSFDAYLGDSEGLPGSSYAGGSGATVPTGDGTDVPVAGTPRALDEPLFKTALETLWTQSGGNENILAVCSAKQRGVISTFTASSSRYVTTDDKKLVASIDVYDGDYHTVTITPDRWCMDTSVFLVDTEYVKVSDLRPIHSYDLAKNGDAFRKEITWETTLEVCNPRAHMNLADLS